MVCLTHSIASSLVTRWETPILPLGLLFGHIETCTLEDNVEVHTVNTSLRIVLQAKIDMLVDTESEVAGCTEVLGADLVVGDLKTTLDEIHGLVTTHGDVASDLLVTADTEGAHSVASDVLHRGLVAKLLQHANGLGEPVSRLADGNVDHKFVKHDLAHDIICFVRHGDRFRPCTALIPLL